jgi:uncharacterized membrane protein
VFIKVYLIALPVFFAIDMFWLVLIAKSFYANQIGFLMRPDINWAAAILFYVIFIAGLVLFVIMPALEKRSLLHSIMFGALFGFISYATYDLTNLATIKNWPILVTIVDLIWGAALSALVSLASYLIALVVLR